MVGVFFLERNVGLTLGAKCSRMKSSRESSVPRKVRTAPQLGWHSDQLAELSLEFVQRGRPGCRDLELLGVGRDEAYQEIEHGIDVPSLQIRC